MTRSGGRTLKSSSSSEIRVWPQGKTRRGLFPRIGEIIEADGSTQLGSVLRARGLDELPQLFNVLRGEMSLIGPRPDLVHQLAFYTEKDRRRLAMRPGITSLAQVSGRNSLSWRQRMNLEIEYVERFSLRLDAQIACVVDQKIHRVPGR